MAKGVECHGRLPASSGEVASVVDVSDDASEELNKAANDWLEGSALPQRAIDLLEGQDSNVVDELAHIPFFPECVYDPATGDGVVMDDSGQPRAAVPPRVGRSALSSSWKTVDAPATPGAAALDTAQPTLLARISARCLLSGLYVDLEPSPLSILRD